MNGTFKGGDKGFTINFNSLENGYILFENEIELDNITFKASNETTGAFLLFVADFDRDGHMSFSWDEEINFKFDFDNELIITEFELNSQRGYFLVEEIYIDGISDFELVLGENSKLEFGFDGSIAASKIDAEFDDWKSVFIGSVSAGSGFDFLLKPQYKFIQVGSSKSFTLNDLYISYDDPSSQEYDLLFEIDDFYYSHGGLVWFNLSSEGDINPRFNFECENLISLNNLHLNVGGQSTNAIDFSIPNTDLINNGAVYAEFDSEYWLFSAAIDLDWDVNIETSNFGNWALYGALSGKGDVTLNEWIPGVSGDIEFNITDTISFDMNILHDDIQLEVGPLNLNSGNITFKWKREDVGNDGFLKIYNSNVDGFFNKFKINIEGEEKSLEFQLGNVSVEPGNIFLDWSRLGSEKHFHIKNYATFNMDLIKVIWDKDEEDEKILTLGTIGLSPGQFNFLWNTSIKRVKINNGINSFGPICTYEDKDRFLSVDLLNLKNDYSKTFTLQWFENSSTDVNGIYVDTDGTDIVDWFEFISIKYNSSGNTGRKLSLEGLNADDFYMKTNGGLDVGGKLHIADNITYSRLLNLDDNSWESLNLQWNLQSTPKWIRFESEFDLILNLLTLEIGGFKFTTDFDLTDYMEVKWDWAPLQGGEFHLDTNGQTVSSLYINITGPNNNGVGIVGGGVWTENWWITWFPVTTSGPSTIGYDSIAFYVYIDGVWYQLL
jgi:hypothetical protein